MTRMSFKLLFGKKSVFTGCNMMSTGESKSKKWWNVVIGERNCYWYSPSLSVIWQMNETIMGGYKFLWFSIVRDTMMRWLLLTSWKEVEFCLGEIMRKKNVLKEYKNDINYLWGSILNNTLVLYFYPFMGIVILRWICMGSNNPVTGLCFFSCCRTTTLRFYTHTHSHTLYTLLFQFPCLTS